MARGIGRVVAKSRQDLEPPQESRVVGLHSKRGRSAGDLFREIEPLDDESAEEMRQAIREAREARRLAAREAPKEPPVF